MSGFVSLMNAVAWPLAVLGLALLFRDEVKSMAGRVGRVKVRDVEVTFGEELRKAEALARAVPSQGRVVLEVESKDAGKPPHGEILAVRSQAPPRHEDHDRLEKLASRSPREAMVEAWSTVTLALLKAASALGDRRAPAPLRSEDATRYLVDRGWLVGPEAQLVERLRLLRDKLDHEDLKSPTAEQARLFVELAMPLASRIATLGG